MDSTLLIACGACSRQFKKGEIIFREGEEARFYYQVERGKVRMHNVNNEGKDFTQDIFTDGDSFGEPPLFINEKYPATAVAEKDTVLLRLPKEKFLGILDERREIEKEFLKILAKRVYNKAIAARVMINNPQERILGFLNFYKKKVNPYQKGPVIIPLTRQEIANFIGLRVETVIRVLAKMRAEKKVKIIEGKIYF